MKRTQFEQFEVTATLADLDRIELAMRDRVTCSLKGLEVFIDSYTLNFDFDREQSVLCVVHIDKQI